MRVERLTSRQAAIALAAIGVLGLALRLDGLRFGLPDLTHPDEIWILNRALALGHNHLNPKNFLYPTLYFYAVFAWEGAYFVAGRLAGLYHSLGDFEQAFFVDPSRVVVAARVLTVLFGVATLAAVYRFGARLFDRLTGLGAALFLAVAPFAVRDAHYVKHDVPVTLFVVLAQAAAARVALDAHAASRRLPWCLAGLMVGLALSTQYYAFPIVLPITVAAIIEARRTSWRTGVSSLLWAAGASVVGFVAASPFFVLQPQVVMQDMAAVKQIDVDRAVTGAGAFSSMGPYVSMIAHDAIGWTTALLAVVGGIAAIAIDRRRAAMLLAFPLAFFVFLCNTTPMSRYVNPMLPSMALAASFALAQPFARLRLGRGAVRTAVAVVGLALIALPGLVGSLRADAFYAQADTRSLARQFLERTAPPGSTVLVQPHGVALRASREALVEALRAHLGSESYATIKFQKQLAAATSVSPAYRVLYYGQTTDGGLDPDKIYISPAQIAAGGLKSLRDQRVAYVAVNRYNAGSVFDPLYAALRGEARLLAVFSPYRADVSPVERAAVAPFFHNTADRIVPALERPGPTVEVWRIDPADMGTRRNEVPEH
jgi:hypothetical protein